MIKRRVYGFAIDLKSTLTSLNLWGSIVAVTLFAFTLPSRGCMLDRLFELLKSPIYQFMDDGGLPKFMAWMMPHTLVSVIIGRETEVLLNCIQFRLPRYRYRSSFWLSHSIKIIFIMKQRLGIAQAIMENPDYIILDEPFNGLDKEGVDDIRKLLLEYKKQGKTILLSSHNPLDISMLCDFVYEMDKGRMTIVDIT